MDLAHKMTFRNIVGWLLLALAITVVAGAVRFQFAGCPAAASIPGNPVPFLSVSTALLLSGMFMSVIGRLLNYYRPENPIGWLLAILGVAMPLANWLNEYAVCATISAAPLPYVELGTWVGMGASTIIVVCLFVLIPALFPTGTFLSRSWEIAVWVTVSIALLLTFLALITPGPMTLNGIVGPYPFDNPFGLPFPWLRSMERFLYLGIPLVATLGGLLGIAAFIARFRRSSGDERQQLKWFAYFLVTVVAVHLVGYELIGGMFFPGVFDHWSYGLILILSFSGFPLVIGLAIFKYRLYDIDLIIRKTLVYGLLTVSLVLVFFGLVTMLQSLFSAVSNQQSPLSVVLSTLAIAALFNPLRTRLQEFIDRRFYRQKYDAEQTLAEFATAVRSETDLDVLSNQVVDIVEKTMQPAEVSMWLKRDTNRQPTTHTQDIG